MDSGSLNFLWLSRYLSRSLSHIYWIM